MGIQTRPINYEHNGTALEGILAIDDNTKTPAPVSYTHLTLPTKA